MTMTTIRPYVAEHDAAAVFALWQSTLGEQWPLTEPLFRVVIDTRRGYQTFQHFVAVEGDEIIGFIAAQATANVAAPALKGNIGAVLVAPHRQRRGTGRALLDRALAYLHGLGVLCVQLGGWEPRFWPGVPRNLPGALAFVEACGWDTSETDYDLMRRLDGYTTPPAVAQRLHDAGVAIDAATEADVPEVIAFQAREFPGWYEHYQYTAAVGDHADILVARAANDGNAVVGALLMCSPDARPKRSEVIWQTILGPDMGALNAVGVAAAAQGRGIGIGLVARGSEILKSRGVGCCHIGWTDLLDFYGKVGYTPWREYAACRRELQSHEETNS